MSNDKVVDKYVLDMAARGRWLINKLRERTTPDGRTVLEIVEEPIWCKADGTWNDYLKAVDEAMARERKL